MRFYSNEEKLVVISECKGVQCNKCGSVFNPHDELVHSFEFPLGQHGNWKFDLCDNCLFEFVKQFQLVPEGFKSNPSCISKFDTDHDLHQELFDEWKTSGEWNYDENPWNDYYGLSEGNEELEKLLEDNRPSSQTTLKVVK